MTASNISRPRPALEEHAADPAVERILFATDGGEAGAGALKWIVQRAKMHRMDVAVVTVIEADWLTTDLTGDQFSAAAEQVVAAAVEHLARWAPSAEVTTRVGWGSARETFAEASKDVDLLVVGTNRTSRLAAVLAGSFSLKLVESSRCPVMVIPRTWQPQHGAVVVGVQGDGSDDRAVSFAAHEAEVLHRELRVVHSWTLPTILGAEVGVEMDEVAIANGHDAVLEGVLRRLRSGHPALGLTGVLAAGNAAEVLTREARGQELLVVGSHGWTMLDRFFLGSVSREVLAQPVCPLAVVRPVYEAGSGRERGSSGLSAL